MGVGEEEAVLRRHAAAMAPHLRARVCHCLDPFAAEARLPGRARRGAARPASRPARQGFCAVCAHDAYVPKVCVWCVGACLWVWGWGLNGGGGAGAPLAQPPSAPMLPQGFGLRLPLPLPLLAWPGQPSSWPPPHRTLPGPPTPEPPTAQPRLTLQPRPLQDLAFIRALEPRIASHRASLSGRLSSALSAALARRNHPAALHCLAAYADLGDAAPAEAAVRSVVVAPLLDRLIREHKAHGAGGHGAALAALLAALTAGVRAELGPLLEATLSPGSALRSVDLLGAGVVEEAQGALAASLPGEPPPATLRFSFLGGCGVGHAIWGARCFLVCVLEGGAHVGGRAIWGDTHVGGVVLVLLLLLQACAVRQQLATGRLPAGGPTGVALWAGRRALHTRQRQARGQSTRTRTHGPPLPHTHSCHTHTRRPLPRGTHAPAPARARARAGIFSPGVPPAFHANYLATLGWLGQLEALCATQAAVERLREGPAYAALLRRWNTSVYFSLIFKEAAGAARARYVHGRCVRYRRRDRGGRPARWIVPRRAADEEDAAGRQAQAGDDGGGAVQCRGTDLPRV